MNLKIENANLTQRIEALPIMPNGRKKYSEEIKAEITLAAQKQKSLFHASKKLGISYITLRKWVKNADSIITPPRRLTVENNIEDIDEQNSSDTNSENYETEQIEHSPNFDLIEVVLVNGVILRHVPFNSDSLNLLGGLI